MAFIVTAQNQDLSFENPPEGTYPARLYRVIDLGTQSSEWQGRPTASRKMLFTWELLDPDAQTSDKRPFSISRRFTLSLGEKAALRQFLEAWRRRKFSAEELARGFDIRKLVGQPGLLTVSHTQKDGRVYANVLSVSGLPRGYSCPEGVNKPVAFDIDEFDESTFDGLSKGLQEQIMKSPEYAAYRESGPAKRPAPAPQATAPAAQARPAPAQVVYPFNSAPKPKPQPAAAEAGFDDDILF